MAYLYAKKGVPYVCSFLRKYDDLGIESVDLVHAPSRFWSDMDTHEGMVEEAVDIFQVEEAPTPANLLSGLEPGDNWQSQSRRSINRLHAHFLICEDPQRRMDVREVETLSHQISLVRHILEDGNLRRVLIADEVGLGKTIEVGLILQELVSQRPELRVLYLAPARLVSNVRREFERLNLNFRQWTSEDGDARLSDPKIIASIHRAAHKPNFDKILNTKPWDVLVVDECHHLSAWSPEGGDPTVAYRLVRELIAKQPPDGYLILMSGTPHQGHRPRFENLLRLLQGEDESLDKLRGRVIYRTKDDIVDWDGHLVFPPRQVNEPLLLDLGPLHRSWLNAIHDYYNPPTTGEFLGDARRRAAGWRCAQAMQWAASSPQAGLGYLVRQAIRAGWDLNNSSLSSAIALLRPYRLGPADEPLGELFLRLKREVDRQRKEADLEDVEDEIDDFDGDWLSRKALEDLLTSGMEVMRRAGDDKWERVYNQFVVPAGDEKIVLFAQPIETVTALARYLERKTKVRPALILGGQSDFERTREVAAFWRADGPRFLVSSRAGGEGINLQVARRLVHIDVPWNPMDLEQRVGRVHRFGSNDRVIVDTILVQDSREADAYRIARAKLKLITSTLVEKERFESVFSRVMSLLSPDEMQNVMLNAPAAPFDHGDEQRLADMVQQGYKTWKDFHDKYGQQQKAIQAQNPGVLTWQDVAFFLESLGGAEKGVGFTAPSFDRSGVRSDRAEATTTVLRMGQQHYVCGDNGESLVFGPDKSVTPKLGLNLSPIASVIRKHAFPEQHCGAAYLRWPSGEAFLDGAWPDFVGILIFLRQTLRMDRKGGWLDHSNALHCYVVTEDDTVLLDSAERRRLLRGLFRASARKSPEIEASLVGKVKEAEDRLFSELRKPSNAERQAHQRHAITPLFAAMIDR